MIDQDDDDRGDRDDRERDDDPAAVAADIEAMLTDPLFDSLDMLAMLDEAIARHEQAAEQAREQTE